MDDIEIKKTYKQELQEQLEDYTKWIGACVDQETKEELTDKYLRIKEELAKMEFYGLS